MSNPTATPGAMLLGGIAQGVDAELQVVFDRGRVLAYAREDAVVDVVGIALAAGPVDRLHDVFVDSLPGCLHDHVDTKQAFAASHVERSPPA